MKELSRFHAHSDTPVSSMTNKNDKDVRIKIHLKFLVQEVHHYRIGLMLSLERCLEASEKKRIAEDVPIRGILKDVLEPKPFEQGTTHLSCMMEEDPNVLRFASE